MDMVYFNSTKNLGAQGRTSSLRATVQGEGKNGQATNGNEWANHTVHFSEQVVEKDGTIVHYPRNINVSGWGAAASMIKDGIEKENGEKDIKGNPVMDQFFIAGNKLDLTGFMKPNQWTDRDGVERENIKFTLESVSHART